MAITYATAVKTARMTATRDQMAGGTLEILTSTNTVLATFTLSASGGTIANDVWTLTFVANTVTASATGTAAAARIRNSSNADMITGLTVGTTGTDITLDNLSIAAGQNIIINSATITHAA